MTLCIHFELQVGLEMDGQWYQFVVTQYTIQQLKKSDRNAIEITSLTTIQTSY